MKTKKINNSLERRNSRNGFLFCLPWIIGCLLFFLVPMIDSVKYAFSDVKITTEGVVTKFVGLENFQYILFKSPEYINHFSDSLSEFSYEVPIIIILSLIVAVILNPKFKGRTFFRSLYFIPVIIATSVIMNYLGGNSSQNVQNTTEATQSAYMDGLIDFETLFMQLGVSSQTTSVVFGYIDRIFDLIWQCGVHIVLFISGLQSIPDQLYEVAKVEGASKWEEFWYITVPMLGNTLVLVFVYSIIDFCVSTNNKVIAQAYTMLIKQQIYGKSSAMLWFYFAVIAVVAAAVFFVFHRLCLKKWE